MSKLLKQNITRSNPLFLKNVNLISKIKVSPSKPSIIYFENGNCVNSSCLKCPNTPCYQFSDSELSLKALSDFSYDRSKIVCPVDAISIDTKKYTPIINKEKCISCGLCSYRCPIKAIYIDNNSAVLNNTISKDDNKFYKDIDIDEFYDNFQNLFKITFEGVIICESDLALGNLYDNISKINKKNPSLPNNLVRNVLLSLGTTYNSTRIGDNNFRMDGIMGNSEKLGVCEIEFGNDLLNSPRNILDDIAVICSRYSKHYSDIYPLIISLELPNTRSEYWRVIQDIKNVLNIEINSISIGALFLLIWNLKKINLITLSFYSDCNNLSIRQYIENILDKNINLTQGFKSVLEVNK
ncbi:4Fe-4S binding protein [Clostridium sp. ZBS2]|uniref:4Fe-4S binding protein n=1 Tax=Clostridium sp. ZBS2 TaxID=2949976 RepID=UPI002079CA22|nr:4Fe-4S binding protein [Clostridium sp. ZBS2]